uniref:Uncharacterized protein n=1 Tax=Oryza rufipogon TaxID=4529 RepID=A0A0E0P786_ORYRU
MATTSPLDLTAAAATRGRIRFDLRMEIQEWSSVNPETTPNSLRTSEECNFRNALCGSSYTRIPNAS